MDDFRSKVKDIYKDDLLDRIPFAEALYNLITKRKPVLKENKESGSLVVAIDAPWGTGKTHFLDYFEKTLLRLNESEEQKFTVISYNAWENDDFEEPLLSLFYCLIRQQIDDEEVNKGIIEAGKALTTEVIIPTVIEAVNNKFKDKLGFDIKKAFELASNLLSAEQAKTFQKYEEAQGRRAQFKKMMSDLIENQNKVVVLVDELDRCRPTYAIELLETVKHYLNVENYIFIFALDKNQLSHSIKTQYGEGMDSTGYLRRFFDYNLNFPIPSMSKFVESQLEGLEFEPNVKKELISDISKLAYTMELSCRDMKIILNNLIILWEIILDSQTANHYIIEAYTLLIAIKYKYPEQYKDMMDGNISYKLSDDELKHKRQKFASINDTFRDCHLLICNPESIKNNNISHIHKKSILSIAVNEDYSQNYFSYCLSKNETDKFTKETVKYFDNWHNFNIRFEKDYYTIPIASTAKLLSVDLKSSISLGHQLSQQLEMINLDQE